MSYWRIKWFGMESVPGKRIDRIQEVRFTDRWGKEYRWSPLLEEVASLFSEMLRMELGKDKSAWVNVFRDLIGLAIMRGREGIEQPEYPELIEEQMDALYLNEYLAERFPGTRGMRNVRLGPTEWRFMRCPQCGESSRLTGIRQVEEGIEGEFKCWDCGYEFTRIPRKED